MTTLVLSFASLAIDYTSIAKCECPKGKTEKSYRLHIGYDGTNMDVHFFEQDGQAGAKDITTRIPIGERLKKKETNAGASPNTVTYTLTEAIYCACSDDDPCTFEFEISYEE
jgi:hypothetical protein